MTGTNPRFTPPTVEDGIIEHPMSDEIKEINNFEIYWSAGFEFFVWDKDPLSLEVGWHKPIGVIKFTRHQELRSKILKLCYDLRREQCFHLAKWACGKFNRAGWIECHHKIHRSKQRNDKLENLQALCNECHGREHGAR